MKQELTPGAPVPDAYVGVWKRTLLRNARGEDTTTQVFWLQTRSWHAAIRIPASRPECMGKTSLDQLTRDELFGLARQQGFCGTTEVDSNNLCRRLRRHDFQPPSGADDIGRMEFDTPDRLFEYGVAADDFGIWERMPYSTGEDIAVQLSQDPLVLLLGTGRFRMRVRPRLGALGVAIGLSALAADKPNAGVRDLLDFEISFGRLQTAQTWRISHSTLPWQEGLDLPAGG